MIQEGFQIVIDETVQKYTEYFQSRLCAIYISGSIHANEAIPGESDLDCWVFIANDLDDSDKSWIAKTEVEIDSRHEIIDGVHINVKSINQLRNDKFTRFALKYNATLCYGHDIISEIEALGAATYEPNMEIAKERLPFARKCLEDAMSNKCPQCIDKIPNNTYLAARKYARYFILVEGVYYLMAKNKFETYKQDRVIQQLKLSCIEFNDILDLSLAVLENPLTATIKHDEYIAKIYPFVKWLFAEIEKS